MSAFDQVLTQVVDIVESMPFASTLTSVTIIRDLKGQVRLLLEFAQAPTPSDWATQRATLEQRLADQLGHYWGKQVWHTREGDRVYQALKDTIVSCRQNWNASSTLKWYKLERSFSKSSWRGHAFRPPWPLGDPPNPADPAIISFFSFKGGVGRTTTLAAVAMLLAQARRRVFVLDLDLEAPGIGGLLLEGIAPPEDGVVDYLLESQLTGQQPANLAPYVVAQSDPRLVGDGPPIHVMAAGKLDGNYLEKIARLDFEGFVHQDRSPLTDLLKHIREEYEPGFILLDVRAGLHDLGGLSLNGTSHLNLIFGQNTPQNWAGLKVVLPILGAAETRPEVFLVHAMVTPGRFDPDANNKFRERGFDLLQQHYYSDTGTIPNIDNPESPYGWPIPYQDELLNVEALTSVSQLMINPQGAYASLVRTIGSYMQRETL